MSIKNELEIIVKNTINKLEIDEEVTIEIPKNKDNGDYSTNIALKLTKKLKQNPMEIANTIIKNIDNNNIIKKVEAIAPGFINFYIDEDYLLEKLNEILDKKNNYGKSNYGQNKKINLEYVSANPTGLLHIGHCRGATYGDNLARILTFIGYDVTREYYVNDAGNQMNNLGISIKERYKELCHQSCNIPEDGYHGKEIITLAQNIYDNYQDKKLNEDIEFFKQEGLEHLLDKIKKDLDMYRTNFDVFTSEQSLYDNGMVDIVLDRLKKTNKCYIEDNALWLKTMDYGDEKDRVLIKNDGNYTYFLPDIAYHMDKYRRGYEKMIDVFGSDHHGYINRLKSAITILGEDPNKLDIKILQMVRLIKNNEEVKLSKRTGKTLTLTDLVEEVGINATRYFFSSKSLDSQMDFDLDLATKQSNENPIYYIEYANARICSILNKYHKYDKKIENYRNIKEIDTYIILKKLYEFEDIVISAGKNKLPHLIANYVYELASLFHSYYAKNKIITDNEEETQEKIMLIKAIKIVLNNALDLIGIIPREQM